MAQNTLRQKRSRNGFLSRCFLVACAFLTLPPLVFAEILQNLHYGYDDVGNVARIGDQITLPNTQTLTYDDLDRLLTANGPYGTGGAPDTITYTYNELGNILTNSQLTGGTFTYPTSGAGVVRPHAVQSAGPYQYSYDNNGNQTGITSTLGDYGSSTTFNVDNRMASAVTTFGSVTITSTFVYDGDGGRVKKTVQDSTGTHVTRYISKLYECETTGTNTSCSRFIWAGNTRIATVATNGTVQYWHGDHLDSSSVITDSTGAKVQALTYSPYGGVRTNQSFTTPAVDVPYKFTGKEFDYSTDFYYYESRYYDPWFGRFISPDSIVPYLDDPQSLNRYAYARNNPLLYTDPSGHIFGIDDLIIVAIVIGATVGAVSSGIQSDWDLQATLLGGVIGGVSAGVGFGTFGPASAAFASLGDIGSGIAGGAVAGAVAGGTSGALAMAAGYKVNIGLAIASGAAAGGIVGGAGAWGGANYGQLAAFAASPVAGASAAAISGADPGMGAAIAAATAAFALGVQQAYNAYKSYNAYTDHEGRQLTNQERTLYKREFFSQTLDVARIHEGVVPKWLRSDMAGITLKSDIYFREGVYVPNTASGVEILGHELLHVQQYLNGMSYFDYIWASWKGYMNNPYEIEAYRKGAEIRMNFCATNPGMSGC